MQAAEPCDVLVIGGGPAGSTAAATLATSGRDVVVAERERHPRFHIGESLLPRNLPIFARLGIADAVAGLGVFKPGAEFINDACGRRTAFPFSLSLDRTCQHAYQVRRADLDLLLFRTAAARGARTLEGARVTDVRPGGPGERSLVAVQTEGGTRTYAPRFVLDASGRDTFMATRDGGKRSNKRNNTAAVYAHYHNVTPSGPDTEGFITVHLTEGGWFWTIPLPDGVTSVGLVGGPAMFKERTGSPAALLAERIAASPTLAPRMHDARLASEVRTAGNYSYAARRAWNENWFLIGDAFAFLDPVFSSGVLLAMSSGERGAQVADTWLRDRAAGRAAARRAARAVQAEMRSIGWLIHRINTPVLRSMFMAPSNRFRMRDGLVSMLGGNLRGARLPVAAFKTAFYGLSVARRFGYRLEDQRVASAAAT